MKLIRFTICCLLAIGLLFAVAGCDDDAADDGNSLVIYTPWIPLTHEPIVEMFYEETGIRAEVIQAGTGELLARVRAEQANPQADIFLGGNITTTAASYYLFSAFHSANEEYFPEVLRNIGDAFTPVDVATSVLMVNTELAGHLDIRGYADLLNPELRGRIALTDPAASASAFLHLANKLFAMGNGDMEAGWEFVEAFLDNVDGVMLPGSSAVFNGVAQGEYWVGLTFDGAPQPFIQAGAPIEMIFMEEGNVLDAGAVKIINNARNRTNAEIFVDFVTSAPVQEFIEGRFLRPVRTDVEGEGNFTPLSEITAIPAEITGIFRYRDEWLDRFRDMRER